MLSRGYTKGRDLYDLAWYLADPTWPAPNIVFLNNALDQTGWPGPVMTQGNWRDVVRQKLDTVKWDRALRDAAPFLEREQDRHLVTTKALGRLLAG